MIDDSWWTDALAGHDPAGLAPTAVTGDSSVERLTALLHAWAVGFAAVRDDVQTPALSLGRRGLHPDEAQAFLRALDARALHVDSAGFVTPLTARPKAVGGRYALFSRSGAGAALNTEYLIQLGAVAELTLDYGWPADRLQVERGEFDLIGFADDSGADVVMAAEAKARVRGPDSLEGLLRALEALAGEPAVVAKDNATRKYLELRALAEHRPVVLWLIAAGARWAFDAQLDAGSVRLTPLASIAYGQVIEGR